MLLSLQTAVLSAKADEPTSNGIKNTKGSSSTPSSNHQKDSGGGGDNKSSKDSRKHHHHHHSVNNASVNGGPKSSSSSADSNYLETTNSKLSQRIVNDYDGTKENLANEQVQAKKQNIGGSSSSSSSQRGGGKNQKENSSSGQASKKPRPLPNKVENKDKEKDTNLNNADVANGAVPQSQSSMATSKEEKIMRG